MRLKVELAELHMLLTCAARYRFGEPASERPKVGADDGETAQVLHTRFMLLISPHPLKLLVMMPLLLRISWLPPMARLFSYNHCVRFHFFG